MKKILLIIIMFLFSCYASSNSVYLPSGEKGYNIDCSTNAEALKYLNWGDCYEQAGQLCREKGYTIIEQTQNGKNISRDKTASTYSSSSIRVARSMLIKCN